MGRKPLVHLVVGCWAVVAFLTIAVAEPAAAGPFGYVDFLPGGSVSPLDAPL